MQNILYVKGITQILGAFKRAEVAERISNITYTVHVAMKAFVSDYQTINNHVHM